MKKTKSFDCVKMTREIRDNLYKQKKDKSLSEFADILARDAHKSSLWKGLKIATKSK
jgi:hypothetical protein